MPTTQQLVRKGRKKIEVKSKSILLDNCATVYDGFSSKTLLVIITLSSHFTTLPPSMMISFNPEIRLKPRLFASSDPFVIDCLYLVDFNK